MVEGPVGRAGFVPTCSKSTEQETDGSGNRLGGNRCEHALGKSCAQRTWMQAVKRDVTFLVSAAVRGNDRVGGEPDGERLMVQRLAEKSGRDIRCEEHPRRGVPPMLHSRTCCDVRKNGHNCHNIRLQAPRSNVRLQGVEFFDGLSYHASTAFSPCFFHPLFASNSITSSQRIP